MRILIQNCKTGRFLTSNGGWCEDPAEARNFPSSGQAVNFCMAADCEDVQVILKFSRSELDVKLPLSASCKESAKDEPQRAA